MTTERLKQVTGELEAAKARMREFAKSEGRSAVHAAFQELFAKYPRIGAVRWTQYTPHFNDGEPCVFSVHDPEFLRAELIAEGLEVELKVRGASEGRVAEFVQSFPGVIGFQSEGTDGDEFTCVVTMSSDMRPQLMQALAIGGFAVLSLQQIESDDDDDDEDDFDWNIDDEKYGIGSSDAFDEMWGEIGDDILEEIFGDGVQVTVTRDEIEVVDYKHD